MNLKKLSLLFFLLIAIISASIREYSLSRGDLTLDVSINPEKITLNESCEIVVILRNVGDRHVRVLPLVHQVTLELRAYNEDGEELPYNGVVTMFKSITNRDLKVLEPEESIETKILCYPSTSC